MGRSIRGVAVAMVVLGALAGGGCKKQESLIVVNLELAAPDPRATDLDTSDTNALAFSPDGKALLGGESDCGKVFVCAD